jgi:hypothetical protein
MSTLMTSLANDVQAIAADQSYPALQLKNDLAVAIAIPISLLGAKVAATVAPPAPEARPNEPLQGHSMKYDF